MIGPVLLSCPTDANPDMVAVELTVTGPLLLTEPAPTRPVTVALFAVRLVVRIADAADRVPVMVAAVALIGADDVTPTAVRAAERTAPGD